MAVIAGANDAGNQRRLEIHHHVPRHDHDIGLPADGSGEKDHGPGFELLIDFGEREASHSGVFFVDPARPLAFATMRLKKPLVLLAS
jgi:hypothetical protein